MCRGRTRLDAKRRGSLCAPRSRIFATLSFAEIASFLEMTGAVFGAI
jgi:hypothetical protein